jgi:hypothetical protein
MPAPESAVPEEETPEEEKPEDTKRTESIVDKAVKSAFEGTKDVIADSADKVGSTVAQETAEVKDSINTAMFGPFAQQAERLQEIATDTAKNLALGTGAKLRDLAKWAWERKKAKAEEKREKKQKKLLEDIDEGVEDTEKQVKKQGRLTRFMGMIRGLMTNVMGIATTLLSKLLDPKLLLGGLLAGLGAKIASALRETLKDTVLPWLNRMRMSFSDALENLAITIKEGLLSALSKIPIPGFSKLSVEESEKAVRPAERRTISALLSPRAFPVTEGKAGFEKRPIKRGEATKLLQEELRFEFMKRGQQRVVTPIGEELQKAKTAKEFERVTEGLISPAAVEEMAKRGLARRGEINIEDGLNKSEMTKILKEIKDELGEGAAQFVSTNISQLNTRQGAEKAAKEIPGGSAEHIMQFFEFMKKTEEQ